MTKAQEMAREWIAARKTDDDPIFYLGEMEAAYLVAYAQGQRDLVEAARGKRFCVAKTFPISDSRMYGAGTHEAVWFEDLKKLAGVEDGNSR